MTNKEILQLPMTDLIDYWRANSKEANFVTWVSKIETKVMMDERTEEDS